MLFFPSKYPKGDWSPSNLQFEDVYFSSADGTPLHGWYCPCESPRATILMAHGNAGHVASRADWLAALQSRARVSTFMFDYRGYGRSRGFPTVSRVLADASAARRKLRELARISDAEMMIMGESLGGAIAIQLAAESPPKALVIQSTFSSLRAIASIHYGWLSRVVPKSKLDSVAAISRYRGPLLHSHGEADEIIPSADARRLFSAANEPKTFVSLPGRGHNDWITENYLHQLQEFIHGSNGAS